MTFLKHLVSGHRRRCLDVLFDSNRFLLVTKNFLVKVQLSKAAIFSWRLTARMLEDRDTKETISSRPAPWGAPV